MPKPEELGDALVRLTDASLRGDLNGDYQVLKSKPIYWCSSNNMCIYPVEGKWILGCMPPSQNVLAWVNDNAETPQEIRGIWEVFVPTKGAMEPDPKARIIQIARLDKLEGSLRGVIVKSNYGNINGGYERTEELYNDKHVYKHSDQNVFMWYHGECWVIGPTVGVEQMFTNSQLTNGLPHDAQWTFAVEPVCWTSDEIVQSTETFVDPGFPACQSSIGKNVGEVEWVRGTALSIGRPMLYSKIEPSDIMQGALGDCWLLAALAALAEFPGYIQDHVLKEKEITQDGKYTVRLYDLASGWKEIVVDDLIPCSKRRWCDARAVPCFTQPHENELYVLLIEKAFAKYAGSYALLSGGCESVAWQILTGQEEQISYDRGADNLWNKAVLYNASRKTRPNDVQNGQWACTTERIDDAAMFSYLADCDGKNYLIGAAIPGQTLEKGRKDGLVEMHAYSLISVKDVEGFKLLRLRNPWGRQEWNGAWSDGSKEWDLHDNVKSALGLDDPACPDGVFFISWDDFKSRFSRIFVSPMDMGRPRASHKTCPAPSGNVGSGGY